jgi:uncharacterized protein YjbI with pentapeptide repeats
MKKLSQTALIAVTVVASALVGYTVSVQATIPDSDGVIHSCYANDSGNLRVIDTDTETCAEDETALKLSGGQGTFVADLTEADFRDYPLQYRDFSDANLHAANLSNANLKGVSFKGANLSNATLGFLQEHPLQKTTFRYANLSEATLNGTAVGGDFRNVNLTDTSVAARFKDSDLSGLDFRNVIFPDTVIFDGANLSYANFSGMNLAEVDSRSYISFENGSNLSHANFSGTFLWGFAIGSANLTSTDFSNATFNALNLEGANLTEANLTGVTWIDVTCPDGSMSGDHENTCVGHLEL